MRAPIPALALLLLLLAAKPGAAQEFPVRRCINLGAAMEAPREGDWGYVIEAAHLDTIAQAGFDSVRLPVRFSAHWDGTRLDPAILERTDAVIGWAGDAGLAVILDLHHFEDFATDPETHVPALRKIWMAIGRHYAGHDDGLIFELFNEPNGAFSTERVVAVSARIIADLRPLHPTRWIVTGAGDWNALDEMLSMPPPGPFEARTFHYYEPFDFTHQQATHLPRILPPRDWGSAADHVAVAADIARAATGPGPLLMGEFGVHELAAEGPRLDWTRAVRRAAEAHGIAWCHWGFSQGRLTGYSAYDTGTGTWRPGHPEVFFD